MSNKKQTAVEFLEQTFLKRMQEVYFISKYDLKLFEQAKAMEKEQIMDAYVFGLSDEYVIGSENYYKQNYEN